MIIDAHQHVYWNGQNAGDLVADMDKNGIDYAWILGWDIAPEEDNRAYHSILNPAHRRSDGTHPGIPLDDLIRAKRLYPDRFILGYAPHPLKGDAPGLFEASVKIHGVQVCGELKARVLYDDPRCIELFRKAGSLGCPVILHIDTPYLPDDSGKLTYQPGWYGGTIDNLERAVQKCPDTNFLGHAPGFWREITKDPDSEIPGEALPPVKEGGRLRNMFEMYPNLYGDLSAGSALTALERDSSYAQALLSDFPDRFLFGRDYLDNRLNNFLKTLDLTKEVLDKIYYKNALRLL